MSRDRLMTLPNAVSMSRLLLAAGFVAMREPAARVALLIVASITDFLDGGLARRRRSVTRAGALIDPVADRFFVFTAVSTFVIEGAISTASYFILISRDIATAIGFSGAAGTGAYTDGCITATKGPPPALRTRAAPCDPERVR